MTSIPLAILDLVIVIITASSEALSVLVKESHASCKNYDFVINFEIVGRGRIVWQTRSAARIARDALCLQPITKHLPVPSIANFHNLVAILVDTGLSNDSVILKGNGHHAGWPHNLEKEYFRPNWIQLLTA